MCIIPGNEVKMKVYGSGKHMFHNGVGSVVLQLKENDQVYVVADDRAFYNWFYNMFTGHLL